MRIKTVRDITLFLGIIRRPLGLLVLAGLLSSALYGQAQNQPADTVVAVLDWPEFRSLILENHPMARRALLLSEQGRWLERGARGFFDPKLYGDWDHKAFDEKQYWRMGDAGLKVPLPFGPELSVGYQWNNGVFLNPERTIPDRGQAALGINLPLLQGLFFDPGRAGIQQAKLEARVLEAERSLLLNDLIHEGARLYYNWVVADNMVRLLDRVLGVTFNRHQAIVDSYFAGELPGVDTLESYLQVQNRIFDLQEAEVGLQQARLELITFLWNNQNQPADGFPWTAPGWNPDLLLRDDLFPAPNLSQPEWLHPKLQQLQFKMGSLEVDQRLAQQMRLPKLDVNYYFLGNGWNFVPTSTGGDQSSSVFTQDYKWGATFNWPLFMRKETAKIQLTQIKMEQNRMDQSFTLQDITNKVRAYQAQFSTVNQQIVLFRSAVDNYSRLLSAELEKFELGESSIFLINSREQKLIEAQEKLLKLQGKYYKLQASAAWAAGRLGE